MKILMLLMLDFDDSVLNELSNRDETIAQERMGARESQKIAALKMVEESNRRYNICR